MEGLVRLDEPEYEGEAGRHGQSAFTRVQRGLAISISRKKADSSYLQVNWAPEYNLTGFVLAGKPALLVLEGTVKNINTYMNEIKAKSWADIPSFQKKVSLPSLQLPFVSALG